ncbi:MAG: archease [Phycisphaerae bacterium]
MLKVQPSHEIFDHTADAGIRVRAPTLAQLLQPAGEGLYAVIGRLVCRTARKRIAFDLAGGDAPILLRDYLNELLILFERDRRCVQALEVSTFDHNHLRATARAAVIDTARSEFHREVKAITYHELDIRTIPGGFEATIIVDI